MLEAHDLAARRGTAQLFAGLALRGRRRRRARRHRRQRSRQDDAVAHARRPDRPEAGESAGRRARRAHSRPHCAPRSTFAGHAPALKDELTRAREPRLAGRRSAAHRLPTSSSTPRSTRVALGERNAARARALAGPATARRAGASRAVVARRVWMLDEPVTALDAAGAALLARARRRQLDARRARRRLDARAARRCRRARAHAFARLMARSRNADPTPATVLAGTSLGARPRPHARVPLAIGARRAAPVLRRRRDAVSARDVARPRAARGARSGRAVGRGAARVAAGAAAAVRARSRRRHARADGAVAAAAGRARVR